LVIVTSYEWESKDGTKNIGYNLDGYLAERFIGIKKHLDKKFDVFGVISGENRTGTGKSTMAQQLGYFISWCIAGGKMNLDRDEITGKFINPRITKHPDKPINFSLDNIIFNPDDLIKKARTLPRNSVLIYDECRGGMDSRSTMSNLNKKMDFFQETCRIYGHVFLLVLPNFFKLHSDYAVSRSEFLLDCPLQGTKRGQWRIWTRASKERLYEFSRKRLGASAKYKSATPDKYGRFSSIFILDHSEYEKKKYKELAQIRKTKLGLKAQYQRDALIYLYKKLSKKTAAEVAEAISALIAEPVTQISVEHYLANFKDQNAALTKKNDEEPEELEEEQ